MPVQFVHAVEGMISFKAFAVTIRGLYPSGPGSSLDLSMKRWTPPVAGEE